MLPTVAAIGLALLAGGAGAVEVRRAAVSATARRAAAGLGSGSGLVPRQLLVMSLPEERKVSYVELSNRAAVAQVVRPLIDSGISNPRGIAYHEADSTLFVADSDQQKIFRYKLDVQPCPQAGCPCYADGTSCGLEYEVTVHGTRLTVMEDVLTQWVAVDSEGNLVYTDQKKNSVNRVSHEAITAVANGNIQPSQLQPISESEKEALDAAAASTGSSSSSFAAVAMYESGQSPHVGVPAGIVVDSGSDLSEVYWANQAEGAAKGTVGAGAEEPQSPVLSDGGSGAPVYTTRQMAGSIESAYGIAQTAGFLIFSGEASYVYCVPKSGSAGGVAKKLADGVLSPRGLVWDGDSTIFVADEGSDKVYSLPVSIHNSGSCSEGVSKSQAAYVNGPFGLALIKETAPALSAAHQAKASGSWLSTFLR